MNVHCWHDSCDWGCYLCGSVVAGSLDRDRVFNSPFLGMIPCPVTSPIAMCWIGFSSLCLFLLRFELFLLPSLSLFLNLPFTLHIWNDFILFLTPNLFLFLSSVWNEALSSIPSFSVQAGSHPQPSIPPLPSLKSCWVTSPVAFPALWNLVKMSLGSPQIIFFNCVI